MSAGLIQDSIGVVSAALALATAWISYRAARKTAIANREATAKVLKIEDPDVRRRPWDMRYFKWIGVLGALPALVIGIFASGSIDSTLALMNLAAGLCVIALVASLRTQPPSRTRKAARFELQLSVQTAMEACLRAASDMGAQIAKYDAAAGVLIAKTAMSWRSFGEIVAVNARSLAPDRCEVQIESDVIQVSVLSDYGANRRNLRHFQSTLFGVESAVK